MRKNQQVFVHVLIVSGEESYYQFVRSHLEQYGYVCFGEATIKEAISTIQSNTDFRAILLDRRTLGPVSASEVKALRKVLPGISVIGIDDGSWRDELTQTGIFKYLQRQHETKDLIDVLRARIIKCADCSIPLPLRRIMLGETGKSWVCAFCGSQYHGLIDEDAPKELKTNVRPA